MLSAKDRADVLMHVVIFLLWLLVDSVPPHSLLLASFGLPNGLSMPRLLLSTVVAQCLLIWSLITARTAKNCARKRVRSSTDPWWQVFGNAQICFAAGRSSFSSLQQKQLNKNMVKVYYCAQTSL